MAIFRSNRSRKTTVFMPISKPFRLTSFKNQALHQQSFPSGCHATVSPTSFRRKFRERMKNKFSRLNRVFVELWKRWTQYLRPSLRFSFIPPDFAPFVPPVTRPREKRTRNIIQRFKKFRGYYIGRYKSARA